MRDFKDVRAAAVERKTVGEGQENIAGGVDMTERGQAVEIVVRIAGSDAVRQAAGFATAYAGVGVARCFRNR